MMDFLIEPWPWYVAGPLIGLLVPLLLIMGNKSFGISSSLRHICAATFPSRIPFFRYDWKKEIWNLFFVSGIVIGGLITARFLQDPNAIQVDSKLMLELKNYGVNNYQGIIPVDLFNWPALLTLKGFVLMVVGGFLVGFGTRYAGGCTSGHSIMGLSNLQLPSLIATVSFMVGGIVVANLLMPVLLSV
jgi:uncharacterized membrane protein YedE/YeeE